MIESVKGYFTKTNAAIVALAMVAMSAFYAALPAPSHAAASSTTGVDYVSDLVTPIKSELTLAIVAGLGLLVVLMAVKAGIRLVKSFGR